MSLYIPGMEMPKTGTYILSVDNSGTEKSVFTIANRGAGGNIVVHQISEAIPVPPHGRLIDADKLEKEGWSLRRYLHSKDGCCIEAILINKLPTIIPAEEGET